MGTVKIESSYGISSANWGAGAMYFATSRGLSAATFFHSKAVARDEMAWCSAAAPSTGGVILLTAV